MAKNKILGRDLVSFNLFGKKITLGTPHRVEMVLIFFYTLLLLWWDVVQNQILSFGVEHRVTWAFDVTTRALDLGIILLIGFHIVLMLMFLMSLRSKKTNRVFDIIIGTLAFFGVAIVLSGFIVSLYSETIRFLFVDLPVLTYYHIGILFEVVAGLYWALTQ
jgi:hypothetical protein